MIWQNVLHLIQTNKLLLPGESVVIAVSGGTDSLALLHILQSLRDRLKIDLHVATLDHGLRDDAGDDVRLVRQMSELWHLSVIDGRVDTLEIAKKRKISVETAAREARYAFLAQAARQIGAEKIVTAHHADDQAETVLMRILRGTGTAGLGGMALKSPVPGAAGLTLIRPLLMTTRADLEAYCREHDLIPREDPTNLDTAFTRNYIRHQVLFFLKNVNPRVEKALLRLAESAAVDQDYLQIMYEKATSEIIHHEHDRFYINRAGFAQLHPALQRRCISQTAQALAPGHLVDHDHILHAVMIGLEGAMGAVAQLGGGVHLRVDYSALVLEREDAPPVLPRLRLHPGQEVKVSIPGEVNIPGMNWRLVALNASSGSSPAAQLYIPNDAKCFLRTRRPGDRIALKGMGGNTQKLKAWMINRKIPQNVRDSIPLLCVNGQIAVILIDSEWILSEKFVNEDNTQLKINFFVYFS